MVVVGIGLALLVAAWWWLGRLLRAANPGTGAMLGTLLLWAVPLLAAPPIFSRDVYSYLAQGGMMGAGLDVYRDGPATLGGPLTAEVPAVWQHTPTPYGPGLPDHRGGGDRAHRHPPGASARSTWRWRWRWPTGGPCAPVGGGPGWASGCPRRSS